MLQLKKRLAGLHRRIRKLHTAPAHSASRQGPPRTPPFLLSLVQSLTESSLRPQWQSCCSAEAWSCAAHQPLDISRQNSAIETLITFSLCARRLRCGKYFLILESNEKQSSHKSFTPNVKPTRARRTRRLQARRDRR